MSLKGKTAIAGLGQTKQGKVYDRSYMGFAVEAVELALADAGLERADLDGLLLNPGLAWGTAAMGSFMRGSIRVTVPPLAPSTVETHTPPSPTAIEGWAIPDTYPPWRILATTVAEA